MNSTFYTDGSVLHQNGYGGFAAVPIHPDGSADVDHIISGSKASRDIQEMELIAVITAIRSAPKTHAITIFHGPQDHLRRARSGHSGKMRKGQE
ncbi:RNase H family protein [Undibacterium arcticum]